jgi:hypothetical protein
MSQWQDMQELRQIRKRLAENCCAGIPHPFTKGNNRAIHAEAWWREMLSTQEQLEELAEMCGFKVEYNGFCPTLTPLTEL